MEKLKLKGMAEEDIYFAKRDRELIEALRQKRLKEQVTCPSDGNKKIKAKSYEKKFQKITRKHRKRPKRLVEGYRKLIEKIKKKCRFLLYF